MAKVARKHKMDLAAFHSISCNGMLIADFAEKYKSSEQRSEKLKVYSFTNDIGSLEAELCISAANSNEHLSSTMKKYGKPKHYVESVSCNGMRIKDFAKKYGNKKIKI